MKNIVIKVVGAFLLAFITSCPGYQYVPEVVHGILAKLPIKVIGYSGFCISVDHGENKI